MYLKIKTFLLMAPKTLLMLIIQAQQLPSRFREDQHEQLQQTQAATITFMILKPAPILLHSPTPPAIQASIRGHFQTRGQYPSPEKQQALRQILALQNTTPFPETSIKIWTQ